MKLGLWIEPEIVGCKCNKMLKFYDDDCFLRRNGEKVLVFNRYFLDYRNKKVVDYMTETVRRMVEDYGAEYIKMDFNQDMGVGTELDASSFGEGLEKCAESFLLWLEKMKKRFPHVVFEGCASGGLRMDYRSLSIFSLMSTSDQIQYDKYPYIAGNILSAVIPEQAAVWSYPVGECEKEQITDRQIIVNMINSFLGRMHLASHLEYMTHSQLELVREGVEYYNKLSAVKDKCVPYLPFGFTKFGEKKVAAGLKTDKKVYLALWNLDTAEQSITVPFDDCILSANVVYPAMKNCTYSFDEKKLSVYFPEGISSAFFEVDFE